MNAPAVRRLADLRSADAAEVGGKAAQLGELIAAGARVPDGLVMTVAAGGLSADERGSLLRAGAADLGDGPFAVRSSGVAEDGAERSFAGMYETVLDVSADGLPAAADRVLSSAQGAQAAAYGPAANGEMAVIVQRMIGPAAAGVALTADPISGNRRACVITAVRGLGERLVSGASVGDEWVVADGIAAARRQPEQAIDRDQALQVAQEARRIEAVMGVPQDIEWAIDADGGLWILQARPMTALPPDVSWEPPAPGAYTRQLRFGEWISEPVTPLFESWLLTAMEERTHAGYLQEIGQRIPRPYHVVVNGWYFYTINWATPKAFARNLPNMLWHLIRSPRTVAGINPSTVRHAVPLLERKWRTELRPRFRAAVDDAEGRVEQMPVTELPALIDDLADLAGESFMWVTALAGAAYKLEVNLAQFYRRHLAPSLGGSHLPLLTGFEAPTDPARHAVASLDWWHAPGPRGRSATRPPADHAALVEARHAAEEAAFATLASSPRRLRSFRKVLADAQHLVPVREEQVSELTIAWPVMRRAVLRIGEALASAGVITEPDDVFFLTRDEVLSALSDGGQASPVDVAARRATRDEQARLVPPLFVGRVHPLLKKLIDGMAGVLGAVPSATAIVSGTPAAPGRASGVVRVIRGPQQFDELEPGEILVASLTAPAWTPLFTRAAAVVTDVGSPAAHASIIAREYGIPAVVGCGDATARLRTGMRVTVDGTAGNVEPA
ncbi:MAG TPA: PEP/pyruvate-binding domain-containing protein [Candidatus Limnocylindria bacterium]|nr:PEP/pyruvate-binding domain-containing protein [Candidatus Limnocylindria bacterium]